MLFPHDTVRPSQKIFIEKVGEALQAGNDLIIHAPTGLGKTAASIAPALDFAIKNKLTVFFLTSRHTQHEIALKTLEHIKQKHTVSFQAVDIIGKKWMCLQTGVERLPSNEFTEFCRALREDGKCDYYTSLRSGEKLTTKGKLALEHLKERSPVRNQVIIEESREQGICPYYTSMELARKAKVIIGDYFYVFHPKIREQFFSKSNNELEDAIIIVDEAHNLPNRIKNLASARLSSAVLRRAISEADKRGIETKRLESLLDIINTYAKQAKASEKGELYVSREDFIMKVSQLGEYDSLVDELTELGDAIREESQLSFIGAVANFLESWLGNDSGYTRILSFRKGLREEISVLSYRCLDPSIVAWPIIQRAHSTLVMSGTLTPTHMYKEVLGFSSAEEISFPSPFPKNNRLNLIIPKTSTKFTKRSEEQYKSMADILVKTIDAIPGNVAIFFPSYYILSEVGKFVQTETQKTVFIERQEMSTTEKQEFINKFRTYKNIGAVLMGVISGNFGEGIDLPGDELKGVVIVGLPLQKPDLESDSLIKYYDEKFGKGWDYGYLFPAFNKTLQSAGRCIRSETDRGVIIFLDERYAWPQYKRCFPPDWDMKITLLYEQMIKNFFSRKV